MSEFSSQKKVNEGYLLWRKPREASDKSYLMAKGFVGFASIFDALDTADLSYEEREGSKRIINDFRNITNNLLTEGGALRQKGDVIPNLDALDLPIYFLNQLRNNWIICHFDQHSQHWRRLCEMTFGFSLPTLGFGNRENVTFISPRTIDLLIRKRGSHKIELRNSAMAVPSKVRHRIGYIYWAYYGLDNMAANLYKEASIRSVVSVTTIREQTLFEMAQVVE